MHICVAGFVEGGFEVGWLGGLAAVALPFSIIRLLLLVAWVYAGVYLVQMVEFGSLVPDKAKSIVKIASLVAGPVVIPAIIAVQTMRESSRAGGSFFDTLALKIKSLIAMLGKRKQLLSSEEDTGISLFDAGGRSIEEIYGHTKGSDIRILDLTERIVAEALESRASDILIDPKDANNYSVRFRIDGVLRTVRKPSAEASRAVINSIKAVSGMDIAERRRPQDGAFSAKGGGKTASFRVASAGVLNGEKLSIRVLNANASSFDLKQVGVTKKQYSAIRKAVNQPSGMILMCGPTGSGKTTTLYAMLNSIDRFTRNVITVEDPVEAVLPEASQIEINPKADITFAKTLRSVLRQDPDVICIGEVRDEETAEIALRAAQTGHLVLATVHSDGSSSALVRLLDLGVSPLMISSGLSMVISQRLLRCLCEHCKRKASLSDHMIGEFEKKGIDCRNVFEPVGCSKCGKTGYLGRTAICDILTIDDKLKADLVDPAKMIAEFRATGDRTDKVKLRKEALKKIAVGITSLEELRRVVG